MDYDLVGTRAEIRAQAIRTCGSSTEVLNETKRRGAHPNSRYWAADLAGTRTAENVVAEAWEHFGGLDAFVSNAAITERRNAIRLPAT